MIHKQIGGKKNQRKVENSLDYILRTRQNDKDEDRNFVQVMTATTRADIENFNNYIKPKNFSHPYITGVLSFEENDTDEDLKQKLMADFEEVLFSGIPAENRPPVLWVQHQDKGRLELNYTTFNALQDGRAFKTYYHKTDHPLFNAFCEKNNFEHGFSSVLDKEEKNSLIRVTTNISQEARAKIEQIQSEILGKIIVQEINNREDLIEHLKSKNIHINRVRKNQISIKLSKDDKPIVFKGDIYEEGRDYNTYRTASKNNRRRDQEFTKRALIEHRENFERLLENRTARIAGRYTKPPKKNAIDFGRSIKKTVELEDQNNQHKNTNIIGNNNISKPITNNSINNNDREVINEQDFRNDKNETRGTQKQRETRTRQIEAINIEQQRINKIAETIRSRQHRIRKEIGTVEYRHRFTGEHFNRFVQLFQKIVRTIYVNSRKNETREKFEKRRQQQEEKRYRQNQQKIKRPRFK